MNKLDLDQFAGHTPGLVYAVEWEDARVSLYTTGNTPFDFVLGNSKDSVKGKAYEEIAKRANAAPALLAECRRLQAENERLRGALEYVASSGESWTDLVNHARTKLTSIYGDWGRAALKGTP